MSSPGQPVPTTAVCTIVSRNYLHFARTLMDSVRRVHPEWAQHVLLVDEFGDGVEPGQFPFECIEATKLPLPKPRQFLFRYTILEANTAVKPWLLEWLFRERGYQRVVYLDPDICAYAPLAEVVQALDQGSEFVLTPHLTEAMADNMFPNEQTILQTGCFNLGFLALARTPATEQFLQWWQGKLEFDCRVDLKNGLFVDQKWVDLAPGFYERIKVVFHPGYNVAYWNLAQRPVRRVGSEYRVREKPLVFFHFSGLNPEYPTIFSKHQNRFAFHNLGDVKELVLDYCSKVKANGWSQYKSLPYAFGRFRDGRPISERMRVSYRQDEQAIQALGDDPFTTGAAYFADLQESAPGGGSLVKRGVKKALRGAARLMPDRVKSVVKEGLYRLLVWAGTRDVHPQSPWRRPGPARPPRLPTGLNITGYVRSEHGVGESARRCAAAAFAAQIPFQLVDVDAGNPNRRQDFSWDHLTRGGNPYWINLLHVNADQMPVVYRELKADFLYQRYNIGFWHWELPEFPQQWVQHFDLVDEIWAPTQFIMDAVAAKSPVPVVRMPHAIDFAVEPSARRSDFALPEGKFLFLAMYDTQSIQQRKNPQGAIDAFRRAFPQGDDVGLVVKVNNAKLCPEEVTRLKDELRGVGNILVLDRTLTRQEVYNLQALCDGFISLHRSEGFGLPLAECMFLGKPVVGTNWSGNVDFMNYQNSCVVDYRLVKLDQDWGPYGRGQTWAEPDLEHAAWCLKRLVEDGAWRQRLAAAGQATIRQDFSPAAIGQRYLKRLGVLEERVAQIRARAA